MPASASSKRPRRTDDAAKVGRLVREFHFNLLKGDDDGKCRANDARTRQGNVPRVGEHLRLERAGLGVEFKGCRCHRDLLSSAASVVADGKVQMVKIALCLTEVENVGQVMTDLPQCLS